MRVLRVYLSASDVYTWQNNFLNNSKQQVGEGCDFFTYTGVRQTCIVGKINILIILNPKQAGDACSTRIRGRVRHLYMTK